MLLDLFILFEVTALLLFVLALCFNNIKYEVAILSLILSAVLFFILGISAFNIEQTVAVVDGQSITTAMTMYTSYPIVWINIGLGFISLVFWFYLVFHNFGEDNPGYKIFH